MSPGIPASPNAVAIAATRDPARSWKPVLQVLAPWLLLEALVAVAFMSAHLAMAIETSLFLIGATRVDAKVHKREAKAHTRGVADRTRLRDQMREARAASSS